VAPDTTSVGYERLEDQIGWYDRKAEFNQRWYWSLKMVQLVAAAVVPVAAGQSAPAWVTGGLGALIVVVEGMQQLFQLQPNWAAYRSTCEALKHEQYLYLSQAGHYRNADRLDALLAERVEGLVSQEHASWSSAQEAAAKASER
jgi:hypothetical protein